MARLRRRCGYTLRGVRRVEATVISWAFPRRDGAESLMVAAYLDGRERQAQIALSFARTILRQQWRAELRQRADRG